MTAEHKVLDEEGESLNNRGYAVVVQDWPLTGFNLLRGKRILHWRREGVYESSSDRWKSQRNFAKPVKISPGIIVRQHTIDPRRLVLRNEQYEE